jgi:Phosphotransferase enzyme family
MTRHGMPSEQEVLAAAAEAVPSVAPTTVERFRVRSGKADVYRVDGADPGVSLVLKLEDRRICALEERVYREVLGRLPVPAIRCHGTVPSHDPSRAWMVMDYADGVPFDRRSSVHRTSLARWLGAVHSGAAGVAVPGNFPDHGAEYWREVVAEAQRTLRAGIENPAVTQPERDGLVSLARVLDGVLGAWSEVKLWMEAVPSTLTHGDLVPQNLKVGGDAVGPLPLVHDWGAAGWGCPMIDLLHVDLAAYAESLGPDWPELPPAAAQVLRTLGTVCWTAFVLIGEMENLSSPWPHRTAAKVPVYLRGLDGYGLLLKMGAAS